MNRLTVLCFAGTYGLALLADLARFVVRSKARWYAALGLTCLGWAVHTVYLANLAWQSQRLPVTTVFESLLALAWILVAIDVYLLVRSTESSAVGLFILPVALGLVSMAGFSAPRTDWDRWGGQVTFWGWVHGLLLLLGAVFTCVALVAGLMYLAQARRLKKKQFGRFGFMLPSLEQSERLNRAAITLAFPLLTFGLLIGIVLDLAVRSGGHAPIGWTDPKVLSAGAMWLVFAVLLHASYRPAMRGRSLMFLTVIAFAFMVFTWMGVSLLNLPTAHGVPSSAGRAL